jgi:hypothetical protein
MSTTAKVLATFGSFIVLMLLNGLIQLGSEPGGRNPGILGLVFMVGFIASVRAIWKNKKIGTDKADNTDLKKD